jgi:hypothetical protein
MRALLAAAMTVAFVVGAAVLLSTFIAQDGCLDSGGAWKNDQCERPQRADARL